MCYFISNMSICIHYSEKIKYLETGMISTMLIYNFFNSKKFLILIPIAIKSIYLYLNYFNINSLTNSQLFSKVAS